MCDAHLTESNFQTRSSAVLTEQFRFHGSYCAELYETKNTTQLQLNSRVAKNGANLQKNPLPNSWFWIFMVPFYSEYVKIYIKLNKPKQVF